MYKILIVEDDLTIAKSISDYLESWNYQCAYVKDFEKIQEQFDAVNPHLVLMDLTLPKRNGLYWCESIRKQSKVPIMFISSNQEEMNIVLAMSYGADDYIVKPFDLTVLVAKIQAILRRAYDYVEQQRVIDYRELSFNLSNYIVSYHGKEIELTKNEGKILKELLDHQGSIVSRDDLMDALWQTDTFIDENTLTVNVNRLRKKLEGIGIKDWIVTKKGLGYLL